MKIGYVHISIAFPSHLVSFMFLLATFSNFNRYIWEENIIRLYMCNFRTSQESIFVDEPSQFVVVVYYFLELTL